MHLILCVDDRDGLSFCGRRLSRDSRVCAHMLNLAEGHKLWMHPDSAELFPGAPVLIAENFLDKAGSDDYCFLETTSLPDTCENLQSVTLYCWNRRYPSTVKLDRSLLDAFHFTDTEEFSGNSHETITVQRYTL